MCHFHHLWNSMFDRHQAEITVMQFTGHSLPAHQSMTVPWDFNPVTYCQPSSPMPMEYATSKSLEWHVRRGRRLIFNTLLESVLFRLLRCSQCILQPTTQLTGLILILLNKSFSVNYKGASLLY